MFSLVIPLLSLLVTWFGVVKAQYGCAATLCVQGHYCKEIPTRCYRPPCRTQAVCVPITSSTRAPQVNKPGRCPGYQTGIQARHFPSCPARCSSDSSCPGSQKCCFYGCGMRCVSVQTTPVEKPGTCPGYQTRHFPTCPAQCSSDSSCPGSQKCCFSGCGMRCVTIQSTPTIKPGTCPGTGIQARHFPTCTAQCSSDSSCPGSQKCCFSGCGMRCVSLQSTQPTKPGSCPQAPYGVVTPCVVGCTSDQSCSGSLKCCSWGCSRRCMSPSGTVTSKPGYCPRLYITVFCIRYEDNCQSDTQCPGSMKCCRSLCGRACSSPTRFPAIG